MLCFFQTALVSPTSEQFDLLLRQLRERLDDGRGETIYEIGIGLGKHIFIDAFSVFTVKSEMASFHFNDGQLSCAHVCNLMMKHLLQFHMLHIQVQNLYQCQAGYDEIYLYFIFLTKLNISFPDYTEAGLAEDEFDASVATLKSLASTLDSDCKELRQRQLEKGLTGQFLVRKRLDEQDFLEIRVAVVGNVDAGKSTLLGVLTHGELDNGRGHARQKLFRHKHEMESGRTSSVGNDILGFDSIG